MDQANSDGDKFIRNIQISCMPALKRYSWQPPTEIQTAKENKFDYRRNALTRTTSEKTHLRNKF